MASNGEVVRFYRCEWTVCDHWNRSTVGELYAWLTGAQAHGWGGEVLAFEERGGELIPRTVQVQDLFVREEV